MTEDAKQKRLKDVPRLLELINEYSGVKPELIMMGKRFGDEDAMEFRVMTDKDLTNLITTLYKQPGIDTVELALTFWKRRRGQVLQLTWASNF